MSTHDHHKHTHAHHHHSKPLARRIASPIQAFSFLRISAVTRLSGALIITVLLWAATWAVMG